MEVCISDLLFSVKEKRAFSRRLQCQELSASAALQSQLVGDDTLEKEKNSSTFKWLMQVSSSFFLVLNNKLRRKRSNIRQLTSVFFKCVFTIVKS